MVNTCVQNFSERLTKAFKRTGLRPCRDYSCYSGKAHPLIALAHSEGKLPKNQSFEWRSRKSRNWLYKNFSKDFIHGFNAGFSGEEYHNNVNNEWRKGYRLGREMSSRV